MRRAGNPGPEAAGSTPRIPDRPDPAKSFKNSRRCEESANRVVMAFSRMLWIAQVDGWTTGLPLLRVLPSAFRILFFPLVTIELTDAQLLYRARVETTSVDTEAIGM